MSAEVGTLVLIHPIANSRECWQFLNLAALDRPVERYEMPGHGRTPRQPDMSFSSMADDIVRQFEGPLHVLGIAVGTFIAQQVLVRHSERVLSALLVNGAPVVAHLPEARQRLIARGVSAAGTGMEALLAETFRRWFTPAAQTQPDLPGVAWARRTLLEMDPAGWADIWRANATSEAIAPNRLAAIQQPISLIAGINDWPAGPRGSQALHHLLPNSRLQYVPGPHMVHLERPASLLSAIGHHFSWLGVSAQRIEAPLYFEGE
ncbi:MAG: alpha/beta fold hydrolase [Chloroflexota bacterium]